MMKPYGNLHGNSGVAAYEEGPDFIRVQFTSGSIYLYTYESNGPEAVEIMKKLAREGRSLQRFINKVGSLYAARER